MNTRSLVSMSGLMMGGVLLAAPASAAMYRCDGNLVTDSPTGAKNCVAMGSRLESPPFSAGSIEAPLEAAPTGAGRPMSRREPLMPRPRATGVATHATGGPVKR